MHANLGNVEDKVPKERVSCRKEVDKCKCGESEERIETARARCSKLELEIRRKDIEYEALETKYKALKVEKVAIEDELRVFKQKIDELNKRSFCGEGKDKVDCGQADRKTEGVVDLTEEDEEEDVVIQLMMENSALELEKKRAEDEVGVWKEKYRKLHSFVQRMDSNSILEDGKWPLNEKVKLVSEGLDSRTGLLMESRRNGAGEAMTIRYDVEKRKNSLHLGSPCDVTNEGIEHLQITAASPYNVTPCRHSSSVEQGTRVVPNEESEWDHGREVRRRLVFEQERSIGQKIAPSTPSGAELTSLNVINVYDSDDESDDDAPIQAPSTSNHENEKIPTTAADIQEKMTPAISEQRNKENVNGFKDDIPFLLARKRKLGCNIITSDTESDDDGNILVHKFKRLHLLEKNS